MDGQNAQTHTDQKDQEAAAQTETAARGSGEDGKWPGSQGRQEGSHLEASPPETVTGVFLLQVGKPLHRQRALVLPVLSCSWDLGKRFFAFLPFLPSFRFL